MQSFMRRAASVGMGSTCTFAAGIIIGRFDVYGPSLRPPLTDAMRDGAAVRRY